MKKILSLAIAAVLVAPAAVMAEATLYGKGHMIIANTDDGNDDVWSVDSIDSRVGIKGSEDLGDGLKAVYKFEFKINHDDGSGLGDRNQYVGLAGGFGTLLLGRHDTPLKMAQGKFDQFGDLPGDIKGVIPGEDRVDNVIAYVSPDLNGLTLVGAAIAGEEGDDDPAFDPELTGLFDHISIAGMYSNGPIYASLAYNTYDLGGYNVEPSLLRGTFIWKGGMWQVGGMFSSFDFDNAGEDADAYGVSGNIKVGSNGKFKVQYLAGDAPVTKVSKLAAINDFSPNVTTPDGTKDNDVTQISVGYEHKMSKRTTLHAGYTTWEDDSSPANEKDTLFAGIIHKF
ncbi:MAG: porin [Candidatus Thiodiazotropha sp. (ex Monitilora ramsayi)]|nr:porin [Candidatus Thiodiazotropha sp. (ex Monitilora ramsayi)]